MPAYHKPQVLVIEDQREQLEAYLFELGKSRDYEVKGAETLQEARQRLSEIEFDVVLTDIKLRAAGRGGMTILREIKKNNPETMVIVFTGIGGTDDFRQASRMKADGYLTKPLDFERMRQVVRNAILTRQQNIMLRETMLFRRAAPEPFVAGCQMMSDLYNSAAQLARKTSNVLVVGETGTGKGLLAESIHFGSDRNGFGLVNCSSLSERSLERILFGHNIKADRTPAEGLLDQLSGGTLVLDHISGLSLRLQERLLQFLTNNPKEISGDFTKDVRIISIDDFDLENSVAQGFFMEALYVQLSTSILRVPSLRERHDDVYNDILVLTDHFINKYGVMAQLDSDSSLFPSLSKDTEFALVEYPFPGNVRELERIVRIAVAKCNGNRIDLQHLPKEIQRYAASGTLGIVEDNSKSLVLCPHGDFYCKQTSLIAHKFNQFKGVYVRLLPTEDVRTINAIGNLIESAGAKIHFPEDPPEAQIRMCSYCVNLQSSRYAIIDASDASGQILYEIGLLHALGVPTLILMSERATMPETLGATAIKIYSKADEIKRIVSGWLTENLE